VLLITIVTKLSLIKTDIQNKSPPHCFDFGSDDGSVNYDDSGSSDYYVPTSMAITDSSCDEDVIMPNNLFEKGNLKLYYNMNNLF